MVLRGICVNGGRGEFPEPIYDGARKNALKQGCSTYPQVEDINVCLKMKDFSLWWRSLSTSTLLRIFMDHCRKCHIFVRLSAQNTVLILYTSSKEHIAEEIDTQEKMKIWKRGAPLFCKYFGPKIIFFVHK